MKLHLEDGDREVSHAFMRQIQYQSGRVLNECLHPQRYYIELEINDPEGKTVCEVGMSHDQFVRLLLCNGDVPVTLLSYRGTDGQMKKEEVPMPDSVRDRYVKRAGEAGQSLSNRITDLKKDLYEVLNSGKVGKKKLEELLHSAEVIESHFNSNMSYMVERGAEEIADIQENAKTQLSMFVAKSFGAEIEPNAFNSLLQGPELLQLPGTVEPPIKDEYTLKERAEKPIEEMTAMEVADALTIRLRKIEAAEDKSLEGKTEKEKDRKNLFWSHASVGKKGIKICYINYQGSMDVDLDKAKRYLKFLRELKNVADFETHYRFEKEDDKK